MDIFVSSEEKCLLIITNDKAAGFTGVVSEMITHENFSVEWLTAEFPLTWKVRECRGTEEVRKSVNFVGGQGK